MDSHLRTLPLLPQLSQLSLVNLQPADGGRYLHFARLLHRQAGTLQELGLYRGPPFVEVLPPELPRCRTLQLHERVAGQLAKPLVIEETGITYWKFPQADRKVGR